MNRTTAEAESALKSANGIDWVEEQRRRKWRWAGKIARCADNRWTGQILEWKPVGKRRPGRPNMRWVDQTSSFVKEKLPKLDGRDDWLILAQDVEGWDMCMDEFAQA